ncbi:WcaF family extracellular polysaccharide biosynthesis acetyltransferase [Kovacikia minuta CCNUW1]|uniref:WcaF family extracellular polysaccharide biosynthesis acetyltransferase n=1 Tax=Kovacikia minuta TaxID=2931930 RepID=UPI001CCEB70C|nr:WcaF family extracellular polysaccharide biosynthesis acetyltransferase [Kovacikia minuta]UBF27989.1 WcaF family extracellular polysaccharide biosynthesis acetyltransferase [Kovacikia minuta CCNUW1]
MHLDRYTLGTYTPGAPFWKQLLWYFGGDLLIRSRWFPLSAFKVWILRCFGAQVGQQVRIKPGVRIKFPWKLSIGDHVWIGENAWIDNVDRVTIESHVCISQNVYLCTGNHDWSHPDFKLVPDSIWIETGSWIAANAVIGPGVKVGKGAVLCLGSVTGRSLQPMTIYAGNPAQPIKERVVNQSDRK